MSKTKKIDVEAKFETLKTELYGGQRDVNANLETLARITWLLKHDEDCPKERIPRQEDIFLAVQEADIGKDAVVETFLERATRETGLSRQIGRVKEKDPELQTYFLIDAASEPTSNTAFTGSNTDLTRHLEKTVFPHGWNPHLEHDNDLWSEYIEQFPGQETKHPSAPFVAAYLEHPVRLSGVNERNDPILPETVLMHPKKDKVRGGENGYIPVLHLARTSPSPAFLPGMGPGPDGGKLFGPTLPLHLYDLGGVQEGPTRGAAPLALRIWIEVILSVPPEQRNGPVLLPRIPWKEFVRFLYPQRKTYNCTLEWPRLKEALEAVDSAEALIPWQNLEGGWQERRAVWVRDRPLSGHQNEFVQFGVDLPRGSGIGPLIDRPILRLAGQKKNLAFRLVLSLSAWWFQPGSMRIPVAGGRQWMQCRDIMRYKVVTIDQLVQMCYPANKPASSKQDMSNRRERAKEALRWLVDKRWVYVEPVKEDKDRHYNPEGWRIMPGDLWAGWGIEQPDE